MRNGASGQQARCSEAASSGRKLAQALSRGSAYSAEGAGTAEQTRAQSAAADRKKKQRSRQKGNGAKNPSCASFRGKHPGLGKVDRLRIDAHRCPLLVHLLNEALPEIVEEVALVQPEAESVKRDAGHGRGCPSAHHSGHQANAGARPNRDPRRPLAARIERHHPRAGRGHQNYPEDPHRRQERA